MRKIFLLLFLLISSSGFCQEVVPELSLENIWNKFSFTASGVSGIRFMEDGKHFSKTEYSREKNTSFVIKYSLETGAPVDTIFNGRNLIHSETGKQIDFDEYQLNEKQQKLLLATELESIYRRSEKAKYYVWDLVTKKLTYISGSGKMLYPTFSPDGKYIAYVRNNNLYVYELQSGKEIQVTGDGKKNSIINGATDWVYEEEFSITKAFFWSPKGDKIAFLKFDESQVREYTLDMYDGGNYPKPYTYKYPKAGEVNSKVSVHLYTIDSRKITEIEVGAENDQYIPRMKWTRSNDTLCIFRMNRHQNKLELLFADTKNNKVHAGFSETSETYIDIHDNLSFLDNGKQFIWTSEQDGYNHIYLYDMKGELVRQVTKGNWEVTDYYGFDKKNKQFYFQATDGSPLERFVFRINMDGTGKQKLTKESGTHNARFDPQFNFYIREFSNTDTPPITEIYESNGKLVRVLEDNKSLQKIIKALKLGEKEYFTFNTSEAVELNGWMIKPANFDKKKQYPLLMFVYGGPGSQKVLNEWGGGTNEMWYHYMASRGYIVACVDNRGTGGRGAEFKKMTYLNLGKYETIDQIEAAEYLGSMPYIDRARIGIFGWSYGGYMTSLCITRGADVFKLAVAVAPVTHWKFYDTIYTERYMRTPQENKEGYDNYAPILLAGNQKGNYLLVHGMADDNVHLQNAVEMVDALVKANKQFDVAFYPNKNHGIYGGNTRLQLFTKITNFVFNNL